MSRITKEEAPCCRARALPDGRPVIGFCSPECVRRPGVPEPGGDDRDTTSAIARVEVVRAVAADAPGFDLVPPD
ncbi:MAG TPA: hypothetical protein VM262_11310 [Acidimicrobiales bacterium]|nr:hypothetical protein [Acidimicrobiales bacterium]